MRVLVIGAGVTGCYTAARLLDKGVDVTLLARGQRATRLERDGLILRDGLTDEVRTVRVPIARAPVTESFDVAMVFVQAIHRPSLMSLLDELPGRPTLWFLGNTTKGFDAFAPLGRDRVLGGFPSVGGTWDGDVLVYADRRKPGDEPFDSLVIGEAFAEGEDAANTIEAGLVAAGMKVEHHVPIMAWHLTHVALILPLAGALYGRGGDLAKTAGDRELLEQAMRATAQGFAAVRRAGYPILPRRLRIMRFVPTGYGARRIAILLESRFGQIALAGHANTARAEMHQIAIDFLALAGDEAGADLRALLEPI